ncbi:sugar ABC transporter ATP-binding protein [Rhizobium skierniewicense]|uniref:sugar ABC transporter ATP-binding protein n=1 Tax=Rhizobium skierniewicense TaxID=984260 RepID=UPI00307D79DE
MSDDVGERNNADTPVLAMRDIEKSFGPVKVLKGVDFDIRAGEVHALMGENGAGKSTMIRILSGAHQPDSGEVLLEGNAARFAHPRSAQSAGIAVVHQELLLFPDMTVAENIFLGHAPRTSIGTIDRGTMREEARKLLVRLNCPDLDVDGMVGQLSVANRQRVEIARALSRNARVLIMDEPTAALAEADVVRLLDVVRMLRRDGVGIVYVSHRMNEIFQISDRVTVLRDGKTISTKPIADVTEASLVSMMVGREITHLFPKQDVEMGATVLEIANLSCTGRIENVSFSVRAGEIFGIAGLVGSGRTELAETIFGVTPSSSGTIRLNGEPVKISRIRDAIDLGIAYVPEDRGQHGLVRQQSIRDNVVMPILNRIAKGWMVDRSRELKLAQTAIERFAVRARGPMQIIGELSGGNQQKVVIAKWLATKPRVLILDEPTRGVDVGAKSEIHKLMVELAREGIAIVMISSELPEVLGMSDRVLVMNSGKVAAIIDREHATAETVGSAMMQGRAA